jgi:hypothetical protein
MPHLKKTVDLVKYTLHKTIFNPSDRSIICKFREDISESALLIINPEK